MPKAPWLSTDRTVGVSRGAFASANLATHVGDDPVAVQANRAALTRRLGADALVFGRAVHGAGVSVVSGAWSADVPASDALITRTPGVAVAAQSADCAALALVTRDGWVAAVHSGWQGLVAQVIPTTLDTLAQLGANTTGMRGFLGPVICAKCYPVPADRVARVADVVPAAAAGNSIDLRAGVRSICAEAGINLTEDSRCTRESDELFSYRRDNVTGRQAVVVMAGG